MKAEIRIIVPLGRIGLTIMTVESLVRNARRLRDLYVGFADTGYLDQVLESGIIAASRLSVRADLGAGWNIYVQREPQGAPLYVYEIAVLGDESMERAYAKIGHPCH